MKKVVLSVVAALACSAAPALAADMPVKAAKAPVVVTPAWDIAFGGAIMSDYNFRGISQSNTGPSAGAYIEPQFNTAIGTIYVGLAGWGIDWPTAFGLTAPSAEIDFYGGWRNTWGAFSLDLGAIYYYYPSETFNGFTDNSDFFEVYAKASYAITPSLTVGANVFYTPDLLNYSATFNAPGVAGQGDVDGLYASITAKWVLPGTFWNGVGAYISGELGHWWIDDSNFVAAGFGPAGGGAGLGLDPSYTYWNAGLAFTYKALTLDLRYHGNDLTVAECASFLVTNVPNTAANNWCDDTFIATIKFDTTLSALK